MRWDCIQAVWTWLTSTIPTFSAMVAHDLPLVWCSLCLAFMLMLDALQSAMRWQKVDPQKEGELWVRVGVDGVPLWKSHVVACTIAVCSDLKDLPMHSPKRHFVFSLLRGTEQKETLENLLKTAQVVDDVAKLDGGTVSINGEKYVVRVFLCGDHMLMYKIAGRDPPACVERSCGVR